MRREARRTWPGVLLGVLALAAGCNTDERDIPDGPCPNGICVNTDAGTNDNNNNSNNNSNNNNNNNNNDPCAGVTCTTPPSQCHEATGTCNQGTCEYALAPGQTCNDGNACTDTDVCAADGTCGGTAIVCNTPPAPMCADADTSVVANAQGTCSAGQCEYTTQQISCPGQCGSVTAGLCPDPCANQTCDTPPTACFTSPGMCDPQTGACSYTVDTSITTCDDGDPCTDTDSCQADGSCLGTGITCDMPPPPTCLDPTNLREFTAVGAMCNPANSMCDYPFTDTDCGTPGCSNGACNVACNEQSCQPWELPGTPNGTAVRTCTDPTCPTTANLPALNENLYRCQVQPIMDAGCAFVGCHSEETPNRRLRLYSLNLMRIAPIVSGTDHDGPMNTTWCNNRTGYPEANCDQDPLTGAEWQHNYDMARLFALEAMNAANNELVTQPLAADPLGQAHDGFDLWGSTSDVRYQAVVNWLNGGTSNANCNNLTMPTRAGQRAADYNTNGGICPDCTDDNQQFGCPGLAPPNRNPPCNPAQCVR